MEEAFNLKSLLTFIFNKNFEVLFMRGVLLGIFGGRLGTGSSNPKNSQTSCKPHTPLGPEKCQLRRRLKM